MGHILDMKIQHFENESEIFWTILHTLDLIFKAQSVKFEMRIYNTVFILLYSLFRSVIFDTFHQPDTSSHIWYHFQIAL